MVTVISFNIEYDAKDYGSSKAAKLIADTECSVALLQEAKNSVQRIASLLGWYYLTFDKSSTAILSSLPIVKIGEGDHYGLAKIADTYYCVVHLSDQPYIPFEAAGIKYPAECSSHNQEPCFYSRDPNLLQRRSLDKRKPELRELVTALTGIPVREDSKIVVGGDFNEPSHLDWTQEASDEGKIPFSIKFPCTMIMEELGFTDTFRKIHPNIFGEPGFTWPDRKVEYKNRKDRIDFIFSKNLNPSKSTVISTKVSDHSIILTEFQ